MTNTPIKRYAIPLAVLLALGAPIAAQTSPADLLKSVQAKVQAKQYDVAIAEAEKIVADEKIANGPKITALEAIANAQVAQLAGRDLAQMDLSAAEATLKRALALPDLKPHDRGNALKLIGKLLERQDKLAEAKEIYGQIPNQSEAQRLIADVLVLEGKSDEAVAIYQQHKLDLIGLYQRLGRDSDRQAECERILSDVKLPEPQRWQAFMRLPCWDPKSKDAAAIRSACDKHLAAFAEKDPGRVSVLLRKLNDLAADPAFITWAGPMLLKAPKLAAEQRAKVQLALIDAGQTQIDDTAPAAVRYYAHLAGGGDVADTKGASKAEQADAVVKAVKFALRAKDETRARVLLKTYETLVPKPARAILTAEYVKQAPFDVGSWLASPLAAKGGARLDRPYGDNLQFLLETDSAVTGRNTESGKKDGGDERTDFHAAIDADGLHLFLHAHDAKAADVLAGRLGGGSFEMYLAPGEKQAYLTFLTDLPAGRIDPKGFLTMYPNRQFRLPSLDDGTIRTQTQPTEHGFATYLFLSWELFYDKLPADGAAWQFESIRWTRNGGFSFGGSESVHNRSSFGDIRFAGLTSDHVRAIQRRIILKAIARYRKAKGLTGPVGHWADADLGDPAFYAARVEPLIKQLDAAAIAARNELSDEQVDVIFRDAVPLMMELPHHVAGLRAAWLAEKQLR